MRRGDADEILERLERRALEAAAGEIIEPELDLPAVLGGEDGGAPVPDLTLGGYLARHDRPPAFTGADGEPYSVGLDTEETGEPERPFVAFLVFVRWAATGAGIMDHVESGDLAAGASEAEALQGLLDLSLYEVKAELDAAIERRRSELEE